jgi:hypothetical protein
MQLSVLTKRKRLVIVVVSFVLFAAVTMFVVLHLSQYSPLPHTLATFSISDHHVYYLEQLIPDADANTFAIVQDASGTPTLFSKDKNNVYRIDEENFGETISIMSGIDPATFKYLDELWVEDKSHVYNEVGNIIDKADPNSFSVTENSFYGIDRLHVFYFSGEVISGADPSTFISYSAAQFCGKGCYFDARDLNHLYLNGKLVSI